MKKILALITACILCVSLADSTKSTEINVWNKVSTDEFNPGVILPLDMSRGYTHCEGPYIFMVVRMVDSEEEVVLMFPNGDYWSAPTPDPFMQELQKEFDSLEDYLNKQKSKEIKKK